MKVEVWISLGSAAIALAGAAAAFSQARSARTQAKIIRQDAKDRDTAELRAASAELAGMIYKLLEATSGDNVFASAAFAVNTPDPIRLIGRYTDAFNAVAGSRFPSDRAAEAAVQLGNHVSKINQLGSHVGDGRATWKQWADTLTNLNRKFLDFYVKDAR